MIRRRRTCAAALLLAGVLSGCSTGTSPAESAPSAAASPTSASPDPATTPSPAPAPSPTPTATVVEVGFAGGRLSGAPPRVDLVRGEQVVLRVTSDVAEEVHVHGYDLTVDVPAGGTGEVAFAADLPGTYEVELEASGRPITSLRVR